MARNKITMIKSAAIMVLLLTLSACATQTRVEPASERLGMAKAALEQARVSGADTLAPELYHTAEDKIISAERAINDREPALGETLAHEATLDARLARLHADRVTSQQLVSEIQAAIDALQQEIAAAR